MGKVLDLLGRDFIEIRIKGVEFAIAHCRKQRKLPPVKLRRIFKKQVRIGESNYQPESEALQGLATDSLLELASLQLARGAAPNLVRGIFRQAAQEWEPIVAAMDFRPRVFEGTVDTPSTARSLVGPYGGLVKKKGQFEYEIRYKAMPQPLWLEMRHALECAAISGDRELAHWLASTYKVPPVGQISTESADYGLDDISYIILRHLMAGDERQAAQLTKKLRAGYPIDFPPPLIEFPLGVVRKDASLLLQGLKALNTRFKGRWDEKSWRQRYEKLLAKKSGRRFWQPPSWDEFLNQARKDLCSLHWLLSPFALAFLNVAAWRGMKSPFDQPKAFSEWVPLSLCDPATATATTASARKQRGGRYSSHNS